MSASVTPPTHQHKQKNKTKRTNKRARHGTVRSTTITPLTAASASITRTELTHPMATAARQLYSIKSLQSLISQLPKPDLTAPPPSPPSPPSPPADCFSPFDTLRLWLPRSALLSSGECRVQSADFSRRVGLGEQIPVQLPIGAGVQTGNRGCARREAGSTHTLPRWYHA